MTMAKKLQSSKWWLAFVMAVLLSGCSGREQSTAFCLSGKLENGKTAHSVSLYKFVPEYGCLQFVDSTSIAGGSFLLHGNCDGPAEAFVRFDADSVPVYFILSNARISMKIGQNGYVVTGTDANDRYSRLVMMHRTAVNDRVRIQQEYKQLIKDSLLTKEKEDSLLLEYRDLSLQLQRQVARTIDVGLESCRPLACLTYRTFSYMLAPEQADSLVLRLSRNL